MFKQKKKALTNERKGLDRFISYNIL